MLGFKGVVLKAHGSARDRAVASAIRVTTQTIKNQINQIIAREIAAANLKLRSLEDKAPDTTINS
jgi:fatty acid/phospholipid biosynthesis enzyme